MPQWLDFHISYCVHPFRTFKEASLRTTGGVYDSTPWNYSMDVDGTAWLVFGFHGLPNSEPCHPRNPRSANVVSPGEQAQNRHTSHGH